MTWKHLLLQQSETFFPNKINFETMASQDILIIGGGPAGLEAAKGVADLGYKAILLEKRDRLGGTPDEAQYAALTPDPITPTWKCTTTRSSPVPKASWATSPSRPCNWARK